MLARPAWGQLDGNVGPQVHEDATQYRFWWSGSNPDWYGPWDFSEGVACAAAADHCNATVSGGCIQVNFPPQGCGFDTVRLSDGQVVGYRGYSRQTQTAERAHCDPYPHAEAGPDDSCWCVGGYVEAVQGVCSEDPGDPPPPPPPPPDDDACEAYVRGFARAFTLPATSDGRGCVDGCPVVFEVTTTYDGKSWGSYASSEPGGTGCSQPQEGTEPGDEPVPNHCEIGLCPGEINGTSVCVPCGTSRQEQPTVETEADGSRTETRVECEGSRCTTTTESFDSGGASQGTSSRSEPIGEYCARFPMSIHCGGITNNGDGGGVSLNTGSDPGSGGGGGGDCVGDECGDGGSFGGSCAGAFTCDGDAVQCAIALEQHLRNCELFDDQTALSQLGEEATGAGLQPSDHPANDPEAVALDFASGIDQTNLIAGSCPGDVQVGAVSIPLSQACGELQLLGQLMVGLSMFAAAFIVFRG